MVQALGYQLVFDRCIGEHMLPKACRVMAAGNRLEDRAVVHPMPSPLRSRFVHLEQKVDFDSWFEWAIVGPQEEGSLTLPFMNMAAVDTDDEFAVEVAFLLRYKRELLMTFDPKSDAMAYACPRTWEYVSRLVKQGLTGSTKVEMALLTGSVGEGPAIVAAGFLDTYRQLPDPTTVIRDPLGVKMPTNQSALIGLCGAVGMEADEDNMDAIVQFAMRPDMRPEMGEFLIGVVLKNEPLCQFQKAYGRWEIHLSNLSKP